MTCSKGSPARFELGSTSYMECTLTTLRPACPRDYSVMVNSSGHLNRVMKVIVTALTTSYIIRTTTGILLLHKTVLSKIFTLIILLSDEQVICLQSGPAMSKQ